MSRVGFDMGYISHVPVLAAALAKTTGPVLELGMGFGSTPLLHAMCKAQNRLLFSYDSDKAWLDQFREWRHGGPLNLLRQGDHFIGYTGNWMEYPRFNEPPFGRRMKIDIAFIDCQPGEIRKDLAMRLKGKAKYIILHDAESDGVYGNNGGGNYRYFEIIPEFKYAEVYRVLRPHTLILSDEEPLGIGEAPQEVHVEG